LLWRIGHFLKGKEGKLKKEAFRKACSYKLLSLILCVEVAFTYDISGFHGGEFEDGSLFGYGAI
jgi:hypothetical protein